MTVLVIGANGATGRLLVGQLLDRGEKVKVMVRSPDTLSNAIKNHENVLVIQASVHDLTDAEIAQHIRGCHTVASCLGHNMTFKGMYGSPRLLVTDAVRRFCDAIKANNSEEKVKFVLMNTTGNSNRDIPEKISFSQTCVIFLLRLLLPPHVDNEKAADYLRIQIGQKNKWIEWAAVRPDTLIDESDVTEYKAYSSPIRSAIFDAGSTSRINVGHFMAELITNDLIWSKWKGKMPVVYNEASCVST